MTEFGMALCADIDKTFEKKFRKDTLLRRYAHRVRDGTSYDDASAYAVRIGKLVSDSINEHTRTLPYMSEEVAREVLTPILTVDHDLVAEAVQTIQNNMNVADGIFISANVPALDTDRIEGIIQKVASYEHFDDARWVLDEPLINYSMSIVDQAVRDNARASAKAGLKTVIIRKAEPSGYVQRKKGKGKYRVPCKWCRDLEGTYEYKGNGRNVPPEVFQKHESCRCTVTYQRGKYSQDTDTKATWTTGDAEAQKRAIAEKQKQLEQEARAREIRKHQASMNVTAIMEQTGFSARAAGMYVNKYRDEINAFGIGYVIDIIHNTNPWTRKYAK